ncbi:MAG TPA: RdgB/HAM1 family non-canonical purine NTP pyrophosphatase [Eubacteriales bacterium]|nr:RdgB/HAM1 family non-canonical purine NTP pyrophosphatase [Eubacteriales bacterium]
MNLVIATSNEGKLNEFKRILSKSFDNIFSMKDIGINEDIVENGETLEENSLIKAQFVKRFTPFCVLADDTGLCVNALNGKPGVRSARFFAENATHAQNREYLLKLMDGKIDRSAYFSAVLTLILPEGNIIVVKGETKGKITLSEIGDGGFGYDSVFFSNELGKTFAQATKDEKDRVSHRGKATQELIKQLEKTGI